ncbi:unnamed protein product [Paramecium sonneborni]|uniref:Uncharacterized protein n=1 Tax=Paramecium sonneborni TaxID=65129 RepID=A0A8S1RNQ5_9CILI|nr:unnamed protein product [Paramecium sonneborni]
MSCSFEFYNLITEKNGIDKCTLMVPAQETIRNCLYKSCYDYATAMIDDECEYYLKECLTRGKGCIPNTEPCSSQRGTKIQCEKFKQFIGLDLNNNKIYKYCSGEIDNTQDSICKQRSCTDNTIALSNKECSDYMIGCVSKGIGCIDQNLPCRAYIGDQNTCSQFMGSNGTKYCWNTSQASLKSNCIEMKCSDVLGQSNEDCYSGMKPTTQIKIFCVFDGASCINYGQTCQQFKGQDDKTCSNYIAIDGPCKVGLYGFCSQRECNEAPNNLKTDEDCQNYHKRRYTTCYGCSHIKSCNNLISYDSCNLRNECTWVQQCTKTTDKCTLTQCFNTKVDGQQCFWNEKTNTCHEQQCED